MNHDQGVAPTMNENQQPMAKIRIGVIFGGRSGEHEVSLMSAQSVMAALHPDKYEILPIGITRQGRWVTGDGVMAALMAGEEPAAAPAALLPDTVGNAPSATATPAYQLMAVDNAAGKVALSTVAALDVIFPVLHGTYGEDGSVQGLLEMANLPYVGAGVVGSAVGMDKAIFKHVMEANGLPTLPWLLVLAHVWQAQPEKVVAAVEAKLPYPVFTKPANLGSSVGISKCEDRDSLVAGLTLATRYDRRVVVEQGIDARELEVSVMGNDHPVASVVGEVRPQREFYDYVAKYVSDDSDLLIPAPLEGEMATDVRRLAVEAYQAIDCAGLGRVDLLLERESGRLYINEINTIPGFTQISMYPKLWEVSGIEYSELLDQLIELARDRHQAKNALDTSIEVKRT